MRELSNEHQSKKLKPVLTDKNISELLVDATSIVDHSENQEVATNEKKSCRKS
jgi:hypothetical protein